MAVPGTGRARRLRLAAPALAAVLVLFAGCDEAPEREKTGAAPSPSTASAPATTAVPPVTPTPSVSATASKPAKPKRPGGLVPGPGEIVVRGVITGNLEGCYLTMTDDAGRQYVLVGGDKTVLRVDARVAVRLKPLPPPPPRDPGVGGTCQATPTHRVLEARAA